MKWLFGRAGLVAASLLTANGTGASSVTAGVTPRITTGGTPSVTLKAAQDKVVQTALKAGDVAPDFTLPNNSGGTVKLSEFRGKKNVILAFYVLAFTGG